MVENNVLSKSTMHLEFLESDFRKSGHMMISSIKKNVKLHIG
jgi:hypothetical protein